MLCQRNLLVPSPSVFKFKTIFSNLQNAEGAKPSIDSTGSVQVDYAVSPHSFNKNVVESGACSHHGPPWIGQRDCF